MTSYKSFDQHRLAQKVRQRFYQTFCICVSFAVIWGISGYTAPPAARPDRPSITAVTETVTVFKHVNVIPMDNEGILRDQTVLVRGGVITDIGPSARVSTPPNAIVIDGRDKFLMPGLGDMHVHLTMTDSSEAKQWLKLYLVNGVTTIRNLDYLNAVEFTRTTPTQIIEFRERIASGTLLGPKIYTSGPWRSQERVRLLSSGTNSSVNIDSAVKAYKALGYDLIKVHDESPTTFRELLTAARANGMEVSGHSLFWMNLDSVATSGLRTVEHFIFVGNHNIDTAKIRSLAAQFTKAGVWNCPTQMLNEMKADPSARESLEQASATQRNYVSQGVQKIFWQKTNIGSNMKGLSLEVSRGLIRAIQTAGGGLLLGTDTPVQFQVPGFAVHHELQALVRAGLTPYEALRMGTYNIAVYLGTQNVSGSVEIGKQADLVLLNKNPLDDIRNSSAIEGVMTKGRWLRQDELKRLLQ